MDDNRYRDEEQEADRQQTEPGADSSDPNNHTESPQDEEDVRDEEVQDDSFDPDDPEPRRETPKSSKSGSSKSRGKGGSRSAGGKSSGKPPKKEKVRLDSEKSPRKIRAAGFHKAMPYILLGVGFFLAVCLVLNLICNYGNKLADSPKDHLMGTIGYGICYGLFGILGLAVFLLPILMFWMAYSWKRYLANRQLIPKLIDALALQLIVSILIHTFYLAIAVKDSAAQNISSSDLIGKGAAMCGGGLFGGKIAYLLKNILSWVGSFLLEFILLFASVFYLLGVTPRYLMMRIRHRRELSSQKTLTLSEQEAELAKKRAQQAVEAKKAQKSEMELTADGYPAGAFMVYDSNGKPLADDVRDLPPMPNIERGPGGSLYLPSGVRRAIKEEEEQERREAEKKAQEERAAREQAEKERLEREEKERLAEQERIRAEELAEKEKLVRPIAPPAESQNHYRDVDPIFPQSDNKSAKRVQKEDRNFDLNNIFIDIDDGMVRQPSSEHAPVPPEQPPEEAVRPAQTSRQVSFGGGSSGKPLSGSQNEKPTIAGSSSTVMTQEPEKPYVFPPIDLMQLGAPISEDNKEQIDHNMQQLAATLDSFHINVKSIDYSCGPTVTRYEITPAAGVHAKSIMNLASDIALAFAVADVRMAQIPGKSAIGVEVPNPKGARHTVYLRNLLEGEGFRKAKTKLNVALGADVVNAPIYFDITDMPHLLVGGATKMGKSVCINCTIMSLLYEAKPSEVKLVLIDPKKVEFSLYRGIPHLLAPIITNAKDAAGALQAAVEEMESRFELIQEVGSRNLEGYNKVTENDPDKPFMPYIVIIIDELADLMMQARDEVETSLCRLLQKGRACGIHVIIGTQRPSVDVVTGLIKSNVPSRIACTVASQVDSRTILDMNGAEKLLGRGDMLYSPVGSMRPERVQGAFVSEKEVENICNFIRAKNGSAVYDEKFTEKMKEFSAQVAAGKGGKADDVTVSDDAKEDPKYLDAVRVAIEEGRMSTSLLQRKIEVGYGRAAKLIDRMQAEGIVSPPDGSKPRTILITKEEYLERFADGAFDGDDQQGSTNEP